MSFCDPHRTVPEVARLLRSRWAASRSTSRPCSGTSATRRGTRTRPITRKLHAQVLRRARSFDWGDGTIDYQVPYGEWISLFREHGLVVEDLLELRAPKHASSTYMDYVDHSWARR